MSGVAGPPTQGNGYARALLGVVGVALVVGGMLTTWFIVTNWPVAFLAATPGLAFIGYGVTLLLACAFYDVVDVDPGPLGIPVVKVGRRSEPPDESSDA